MRLLKKSTLLSLSLLATPYYIYDARYSNLGICSCLGMKIDQGFEFAYFNFFFWFWLSVPFVLCFSLLCFLLDLMYYSLSRHASTPP